MIRALPHRCSIWRAQTTTTDAYGQPSPSSFATTATDARCRLDASDAETPVLLLSAAVAADVGDRVSDVQDPRGNVIDADPFAVIDVDTPVARAAIAYRKLRLRRLTAIDQT